MEMILNAGLPKVAKAEPEPAIISLKTNPNSGSYFPHI